jgi:hypothetical protein
MEVDLVVEANVMVTQDLVFPGPLRRHGAPMKLKPIQTYPAAELKGRVPGELNRALTAYAAYYRETTGQTIEVWALVVQMLEQFMATDREFQAWRWRTQNAPGAGPMAG